MKLAEFRNEQLPVPVRHAIRDALIDRSEQQGLSTYALAEKLNSSQSTVYNALKHSRFGRMFAELAIDWLGMSIDQIVAKYGKGQAQALVAEKPTGKLSQSIKTLASKLKWLPVTVEQVEALHASAGDKLDLVELRRAGTMYEAVNRDLLADA